MKIVFFTSGLSGGGAERVCCNLANFLCQREHDIEFITISDDEATYPLSTKISRQALLHQQERSNFLHDNLLRFYRVCKLIRKTRCDCYIVMLPIPTILLLSLRFLTKAKIIASERVDPSTYPPSKQKRLKKVAHLFVFRILLLHSDRLSGHRLRIFYRVPAFLPVSLRFSDVSGHNPVVVLSIVFYLDIPLS